MSKISHNRLLGNRKERRPSRRNRMVVGFDSPDNRVLPVVSATFSSAAGVLSIIGDALDNNIVVCLNAAGNLINGGAEGDPGRAGHRRQHETDPSVRSGR